MLAEVNFGNQKLQWYVLRKRRERRERREKICNILHSACSSSRTTVILTIVDATASHGYCGGLLVITILYPLLSISLASLLSHLLSHSLQENENIELVLAAQQFEMDGRSRLRYSDCDTMAGTFLSMSNTNCMFFLSFFSFCLIFLHLLYSN